MVVHFQEEVLRLTTIKTFYAFNDQRFTGLIEDGAVGGRVRFSGRYDVEDARFQLRNTNVDTKSFCLFDTIVFLT